MNEESGGLQYRPLHAPREDRGSLILPPLAETGSLVAENLRRRREYRYDFQGRSYEQLSRLARGELLDHALRWTAAYRDVGIVSKRGQAPCHDTFLRQHGLFGSEPVPVLADPERPVLMAGHQPDLFHPGVWLKNFALGALGRQHGATTVNLVIDSDTPKTLGMRTPGGSVSSPRVEIIPWDQSMLRVPYEERPILDRPRFVDFGRRVALQIAPLVGDPLVREYWPMVLARARDAHNLGECLAQARHQLEGRWGSETLELPQSRVCDGESFLWLVAHVAAHLPRFRDVYNGAVGEYRRVHRIRNAAHPVPDLAADATWLEAPFWVWTADDPRRRRLFAGPSGRQTVLTDRQGLEIRLDLGPESDAARAVEQLREANRRGVKVRSRALITTLWARLVLGDLFVHGIGGAKYDQVTDLILHRFFGLQPPGIMVVSATLLLPVERMKAGHAEARAIERQLRELTWHPEKHIAAGRGSPDAALEELIAAKRRWIDASASAGMGRRRWQALRRINEGLQPWVVHERRCLLHQREGTADAMQTERVLSSRDYGFCLYPEKTLREFFDALLPKSA